MNKFLSTLFLAAALSGAETAAAAVNVTEAKGWFESGYVTWEPISGAVSYNVYYKAAGASAYTKLDDALIRDYGTYGRADVVGIKAGDYQMKVVPVDASGAEMTGDATETNVFTAAAHDRGGFAHFKTACSTFNPANGVGAYKNDGTLKAGAKVIYVYADNAKTISTDVIINSKGGTQTFTGFQTIIDAYQKGYDTTPIDFRIIGTIKAEDMDKFSSSAEGVQIKGRNAYSEMNITIEGIGNDAVVHGFGFLIRNAASVELRNFAIMYCMDDAVSMDTDNSNLWVHNLDLFYGRPGSAADQKKGDGTLDIKGDSKYSTLSYNHLWDSGKSSLCGMTSESGPNYLTYHHNWFDHSDSRHPRIRTMSVHVYNNYYDGNSKYGVGSTTGSDVFVENNYFRNCKYPMLTSKQGSDVNNGTGSSAETKGTFSGEEGGSIKAYGNYMTGQKKFQAWTATGTNNTHFDAYVVANKEDKVPATVTSLLGGNTYSNFDTDPSLMYTGYTCHEAKDVKSVVTGELGAGRCQGGDFKWTFGSAEDSNDQVIQALTNAVQAYKSTLVGFFGKAVSNGGGSVEDNQGSSNDGDENVGGDDNVSEDDGNDNNVNEEIFLAGEVDTDYFWFNEDNKATVENYLADGTITLVNGTVAGSEASTFQPTYSNITYKKDASGAVTEEIQCQTVQSGSLQLAKASAAGKTDGGKVVIRCPKGVSTFAMYAYRTGSVYFNVYTSNDSVNWTKKAYVEKGATGICEKDFTTEVADKDHFVYIMIENTSTGGLNIQGVRILNIEGAQENEPGVNDNPGENPGENPGDEPGKDPVVNPTDAETVVCDFTNDTVSSSMVSIVTGNFSHSKGTVTYGGNDYTYCVKMETATDINITPAFDCTVTLVFGPTETGKRIKLDGATCTTDAEGKYSFEANGGQKYNLKKGDSINLFLVIFTPKSTPTGINGVVSTTNSSRVYSVQGVEMAQPAKGQLNIVNGKKFLSK